MDERRARREGRRHDERAAETRVILLLLALYAFAWITVGPPGR